MCLVKDPRVMGLQRLPVDMMFELRTDGEVVEALQKEDQEWAVQWQ